MLKMYSHKPQILNRLGSSLYTRLSCLLLVIIGGTTATLGIGCTRGITIQRLADKKWQQVKIPSRGIIVNMPTATPLKTHWTGDNDKLYQVNQHFKDHKGASVASLTLDFVYGPTLQGWKNGLPSQAQKNLKPVQQMVLCDQKVWRYKGMTSTQTLRVYTLKKGLRHIPATRWGWIYTAVQVHHRGQTLVANIRIRNDHFRRLHWIIQPFFSSLVCKE